MAPPLVIPKTFHTLVLLFKSCSYIDLSNVANTSNEFNVVIDPTQVFKKLVNIKKRKKKV
jgi:hypothetical protein